MKVFLVLLLCLQLVASSHFRALWLQWTRTTSTAPASASPNAIPINVVITSAWRDTWTGTWSYAMGNGQAMALYETARGSSVDSAGSNYNIVTQQGDYFGYDTQARYTLIANSCCRISGLANANAHGWMVMAQKIYLDLSDANNPGSPQTNIPVMKQIGFTQDGSTVDVPIVVATLAGETGSLSYSLCDLAETGLSSNAPISISDPTRGIYTFDPAGSNEGDRFAACIEVSDGPAGSGDTMYLDFMIDLVSPNNQPVPDGVVALTTNIGQPVSDVVTCNNPGGGPMQVGVQFNPPGVEPFVTITTGTGQTISSSGITEVTSPTTLTVTLSPGPTTVDTSVALLTFTEKVTSTSADHSISLTVRPDLDCEFVWSEWSVCSTSCGGAGTQTRQADITRFPSGNGMVCPVPEQQSCNTEDCIYTCTVGTAVQERNPDETCRTCRIQIDDNEQCGTCYKGYVLDESDWTCKEAECGDKGEERMIAEDGYKYLTSCRSCDHGFTNSPITVDDDSCACENYDDRALVQPDEAFLITAESEPADGLYYTKLDQGVVFIMFEESSSILRGATFQTSDFDLIDEEGNKASDTCKNKFVWDFNPDAQHPDVAEETTGECPERRQVLGRIKLVDLMDSQCGTRIPDVSEAVDGVLTVTVRFAVNGKRWVRPQDDEEGSLVDYYIEQFTVTPMPLQYQFPLSVEVESQPAEIFNAASSTYLRCEIDIDSGLVDGVVDDLSPVKVCEKLSSLAMQVFDDPASANCDYRPKNPPNAFQPVSTESGYFTIKVKTQEANVVDDLCGSDIVGDDKCSSPDSRTITYENDFTAAFADLDALTFNCKPHSALFAPRAVTLTKVVDVATPDKDPKAMVQLTMTTDYPFALDTPIAPWDDDRFPYSWRNDGDECSNEQECTRDFTLILYDEPNESGERACTFSGTYTVAFAVNCRVYYLENGGDCPVQPNYLEGGMPTVQVQFTIDTGFHCPTLAGVVYLDAAMWSYSSDVTDQIDALGTYTEYDKPVGADPETYDAPDTPLLKAAFINNQVMYFRAQVRSDEAGLATAKFTVVKIVPLKEDGTDDENAITFLYDEKQNGITEQGSLVGFEVKAAAEINKAAAKPDQTCRQGTNADCWLMPSFQVKANVNVRDSNDKLVFNVDRRSSASFKFAGTIAVTYTAGGIGTRRRLLDFSLPRRSMLQEAEAPTDQEVPAAAEAEVNFDEDFDDTDEDDTTLASAPEAEYGDDSGSSSKTYAGAMLCVLALAAWY